MKGSDDLSLFAWTAAKGDSSSHASGLLAETPACFAHSGRIVPRRFYEDTFAYSMTNIGLHIELPLQHRAGSDDDEFIVYLDCETYQGSGVFLCLLLKCYSARANQFCRINLDTLKNSRRERQIAKTASIYIRRSPLIFHPPDDSATRTVRVEIEPESFFLANVYPNAYIYRQTLRLAHEHGRYAVEIVRKVVGTRFVIILSITASGICLFRIEDLPLRKTLREILSDYRPTQWLNSLLGQSHTMLIGPLATSGNPVSWRASATVTMAGASSGCDFVLRVVAEKVNIDDSFLSEI
jgi:hypothetical protein